jgi:hypothetical protein
LFSRVRTGGRHVIGMELGPERAWDFVEGLEAALMHPRGRALIANFDSFLAVQYGPSRL